MREVIDSISLIEKGKFPKKQLEEIIENKEEVIPELLQVVDQFIEDPSIASNNPRYFGHIYAFFLLGQFREKALFHKLLQILHWSEEDLNLVFGDFITEGSGRILASVYNGDLDALKELLENEESYEFARGQAVAALTILVLQGQLDREDISNYYRQLLKTKRLTPYLYADVIVSACDLHFEDLLEDIQWAYEKGLVDYGVINFDDVKTIMLIDKKVRLDYSRSDVHNKYIDNTIKELQSWYIFNQNKTEVSKLPEIPKKRLKIPSGNKPFVQDLKIGRNDPCNCGSGKKYKKCCGSS
ncbi:hypothetical protein J2T56_001135 [Natronobacillus azotifigens]|uniref:DUF1186 domain-containing protein n=1 Tax=Natronobacillus azotifigens TaxID=472978 RepID=A0A9J6RBB1_9BACI|nr:DUF1186 domain-containing protein [Natronobacillus azotifigens]MCZ0702970.1 DUF1186 domain-containing protein [Natronobacillus azotifigens]